MSDPLRHSPRWQTAGLGALVLVAVGFLYATPLVVAGAAIPVAFAAYDALSAVPGDAELAAERAISPASARPGERVTVTLTVRNEGNSVVPDLRVVDGVPEDLAVVDGSPRLACALRTGQTATVSYDLVAKRGTFEFAPPVARGRSFAGSEHATTDLPVTGDTDLVGQRAIDAPPVDNAALLRAGTQATDRGGPGVEFFRVREYHHGDRLNRLNWRQYAKTGDLSTVEFREEHATRTAIVVDARRQARVSPEHGHPTGAELAAYSGSRLQHALDNADVETLVTAVGLPSSTDVRLGPDNLPWAAADTATTPEQVFDAVEGVATDGPTRKHGSVELPGQELFDVGDVQWADDVRQRLPPRAEVVVVSPLVDNWAVEFAASVAPYGYPVTVVSPDVTTPDTDAGTLLGANRDIRRTALSRAGIPVVDWQPDTPLDAALDRSLSEVLS